MNKKQLEKENELLKAKLLIKEHTKNYVHIPFSWKAVGTLSVLLGSVGLAIANFFIIIYSAKILN